MRRLNALLMGLAALVPMLSLNSSLCAQDDPFATQPPPAFSTPSASTDAPQVGLPAIDPNLSESSQLIIESVQNSAPSSAIELGHVVRTMLDIEQYEFAKFYLNRLDATLTDDEQRYHFQQVIGSNFLLEIQMNPAMQPEGQAFAAKTFAGAKLAAYQPARLNSLVKDLSDPSSSVRGVAFRQLKRLESPAAAAIVNVFADEDRSAEFPYLRGAIRKMGEAAIEPLVGAARSNRLRVQIEAIRALNAYPSPEASDAMLRAYLSPKFPESLRRSALDSLVNDYEIQADPIAAENKLYQRALDFLTGKIRIPSSRASSKTIWRWDNSTNRLEPLELDVETIIQVKAADRAADLFEIRPESPRNRTLFLLTQLESSKRLLGPSKPVEVARLNRIMGELTWQEIDASLGQSIRLNLIPAACGACEILAKIGTSETVLGSNGSKSNLVKSILSGERHLQFAAFQAITEIDPETAYNGSSYLIELAAFLANGGGGNKGLVGHQITNMAQSYAATLSRTGHVGVAANDSREFFNRAKSDPDIRLLIISDTLDYPNAIELAQQLRRDWRTKLLPIGMMIGDEESSRRMERLFHGDPRISIFPFTLDAQMINIHMQQMGAQQGREWQLTPDDRRRHSFAAMDWLGKISSDRERYGYYDLGRHEEALTKLIYTPGFSQVAAKILSALGTPAAQREMINFASQNNLPIDERKPIADAFIESINRSGTLLTTREIRTQYDRYNASEFESKPSQELLGSILDAIESQVRVRAAKDQ